MQRKGSSSRQSRGRTHGDQRRLSSRRRIQCVGRVDDHAAPRLGEHTCRQPFEYCSPPENCISFAT
jgi:hypothetical protein